MVRSVLRAKGRDGPLPLAGPDPAPNLAPRRVRVSETDNEGGDRGQNKATARILAVLSEFASDTSGFGVTELSNQLGMTKNMVYRALTTLVEQGYLVRDPSHQRYQLGFRVLELQNENAIEPDFRELCAPYVRKVFQLTGESVSLMVRAGDYAVFIDGVETRRPGTYRSQIGGLRPLHSGASGRVMLAFSSDQDISDYVARRQPMRLAPDGELTPERLWSEIAGIRKLGYARMVHPGALPMLATAFPIWDMDNGLHGVLSSGAPLERFASEIDRLMPSILAIVDELCHRTRLYPADTQQWEMQ